MPVSILCLLVACSSICVHPDSLYCRTPHTKHPCSIKFQFNDSSLILQDQTATAFSHMLHYSARIRHQSGLGVRKIGGSPSYPRVEYQARVHILQRDCQWFKKNKVRVQDPLCINNHFNTSHFAILTR